MSFSKQPSETMTDFHNLYGKWVYYAHLPHDTDWTLDSYKKIMMLQNVEESIALIETIPEVMVKNCMLFLMRENIKPIWEDVNNRKGGCFSFKVHNKNVYKGWKNICYMLLGETLVKDNKLLSLINGLTISPKKNFCIIKIWMKNCDYQNINIINDIEGLEKKGVIFKKHNPEY
jgi:hypothetical protein